MLPRLLLALAAAFGVYTYLGYPAILTLVSARRRSSRPRHGDDPPEQWPRISIALPVYNEAAVIGGTLGEILAAPYPVDRRQILVVSDASTDGTDAVVAGFRDRGVELLQLPQRQGKTAAENAARCHLTGAIIINTDASVHIHPGAIKHLVAALRDPDVGVASGRDVSVANLEAHPNAGEEAYVGYEMWVRDAETTTGGIVGASGCLYAIRAALHAGHVPEALSRDFAAALTAREHGFRAVSVPEAVCFVPRGASLRQEYRRKVRTITRGLGTLVWKRTLLNPWRYGVFAWMLFSHKVCRWLVPWALLLGLGALAAAAPAAGWARAALAGCGVCGALAAIGWLWPEGKRTPRLVALPAYVVAGNVAVLHAWVRVLVGARAPVWEPTRRGAVPAR
ncbi:MAG TPA: glycosyltransferase [Gemmatimonadales bacterium]|jgi:cellulose synthase/poly-beta-1,6-N-acetylglucosamine synthase-like glycosyltransferase|nr:glycosyltransferase [Gemmatimonadales bacterium]